MVLNRHGRGGTFDAYCFDKETQLNQISEPIKTKFGYHLVRLEERMEAHVKPLDSIEEELLKTFRTRKFKNCRSTVRRHRKMGRAQISTEIFGDLNFLWGHLR